MEVLKAGSKNKKGTASTVVDLSGKFYHFESQAKKANFPHKAVMEMRETKGRPILDKIKSLLNNAVDSAPPKPLLGILQFGAMAPHRSRPSGSSSGC